MLAGGEKSRVETRVTAMMAGTMRDASGTRKVRVTDLSAKGMLVVSERAPARGEFIDVVVNGHSIAGQVRWVNGRRVGVRSAERIDVEAIVSGKRANKRIAGKKIVEIDDPDKWDAETLLIAYGLLGLTAFATAYLIVTFLIL